MPENSDEIVFITTVDSDIHAIQGEIDLIRMKIERNRWLLTTDGRYVLCDKVVSAWIPSQEEIEGWLESTEDSY